LGSLFAEARREVDDSRAGRAAEGRADTGKEREKRAGHASESRAAPA
jgi:hypothetical protein